MLRLTHNMYSIFPFMRAIDWDKDGVNTKYNYIFAVTNIGMFKEADQIKATKVKLSFLSIYLHSSGNNCSINAILEEYSSE
jgi:hypothetical protein